MTSQPPTGTAAPPSTDTALPPADEITPPPADETASSPAVETADRPLPTIDSWLPAQRWFTAKGTAVADVRLVNRVELVPGDAGQPAASQQLLLVRSADGTTGYYQVVLRSGGPTAGHPAADLVSTADGGAYFEAAAHPETALAVLKLIADGTSRSGVRFSAEPGVDLAGLLQPELARAVDGGSPVAPGLVHAISAEQSNTSVVFGDQLILKLFRHIVPGINADLELHRALTDVGSEHVAPVLGTIEGDLDGAPVTYGMLQRYAPDAMDGWELALASARRVLHPDPVVSAAGRGDFESEGRRLGHTIADIHADLRVVLGMDEVPVIDLVERFEAHLATALVQAPALGRYAQPLRTAYRRLRDQGGLTLVHRVHGDLHLGQVLRTPVSWWVLDFEGEPARSVAERRELQSPLRDVASMLRSFDYAALHAAGVGVAAGGQPEETADLSMVRSGLAEWATRSRDAFLRGYAEQSGLDLAALRPLLYGYELDRLVYEVRYEALTRPGWQEIPLTALDRLLQEESR